MICFAFAACSDDHDEIDKAASAPVIKFPLEKLDIDLNRVDNLPVVAVIQSKAGLEKVEMQIQTSTGTIEYKTVNEFFDVHSYSLAETPDYAANYQAFVVNATDRLGHTVSSSLPISVTAVVERPVITFNPPEIVYDEMLEHPVMPRTAFTITSEAGLKSVEMYLVSANGQISQGTVSPGGEKEYSFDELIQYKEGDRGFKVKAEDMYGYITIVTLPVTYKTIPAPVLTLPDNTIEANAGEKKPLKMHIEAVRGVHEVMIYRIENGQETEVFRQQYNAETKLDIAPEVELTDATTHLKVVVSDGRENKLAVGYVDAVVGMEVATVQIASQPLANAGSGKYPQALGLLSFRDMKTYSVDYALGNEEQSANVDMKFYCFGGSAVPRLYSMDNTEKDGEFQSGTTGKLSAIKVKNKTRFALLNSFDFETATAATIRTILSSTITASKLTPVDVGDVIAFRTGSSSSAGGGRIGVMKIISITAPKEVVSTNPTARVMTVQIKFPKK